MKIVSSEDARRHRQLAKAIYGWIVIIGIIAAVAAACVSYYNTSNPKLNPADYSACSDLDQDYGVDLATAMCVDDSGNVVKYTDTPTGHQRRQLQNELPGN